MNPAEQAKLRGNEFFKKGKLDAAVEAYTEAISLDPSVSIYYTNRAFCRFKKAGNDICADNVKEIEDDSRRSLELDPRNAKGNYYLGKVFASKGDLEQALSLFQRAYDIIPPFKDDVQKAMRKCRKQLWQRDREVRHEKASEAFTSLVGLLEKARGELGEDKFRRVSDELQHQFKADLEMALDESEREVPEHLQCKITWAPLVDPVITPAGLTYERSVLLDHLRRGNHFEPVTRERLMETQLYPNKAIRDAVDAYAEEHPECFA